MGYLPKIIVVFAEGLLKTISLTDKKKQIKPTYIK